MRAAAASTLSENGQTETKSENHGKYYLLFFISGFPALLYQIVWQRALFTIYGVNVESVTVIVAVFMLGLGIGSLLGGWLSTRNGLQAIQYFGLIEFLIGIFGLGSLRLFRFAADWTAGASTTTTAVSSFALLLLPTLLMGSTLPLLVAHLVRGSANVGGAVGALYAVNTFGSSAACFFAAFFAMRVLGQSGSVTLAAVLNFLVGTTAWFLSTQFTANSAAPSTSAEDSGSPSIRIPIPLGVLLASLTGFIALAYEVLWYRVYAFASGGRASCFAKLLAFYLLGIAYGAFAAHDACKTKLKRDCRGALIGCAKILFCGTIAAFLVSPAVSIAVSSAKLSYEITYILVAIAAALLGAAFPLLCHAAIDPVAAPGRETSYIYLGNILGSVLGSYLIGFVIFDHLSIGETSSLLLALGLALSIAIAIIARAQRITSFATIAALSLVILLSFRGFLFNLLYERLLFKNFYSSEPPFKNLVENRSGVIAVTSNDTVYGGGAYDGHFNIDPVADVNGIFRAYSIPAIHPSPKEVLIIGLSSGSWAQILANEPDVQNVTIVEINPGYLQLIRERGQVASLLQNPKVHIAIDDGRRWLVGHPDRQFDFILMNTTFNWRANITNLLSVDFLRLARRHLRSGGVLYYNTTDSGEVQYTGASVFSNALRIGNFLAVSDAPLTFDRARLRNALESYQIDGRSIFNLNDPSARLALDKLVSLPMTTGEGGDQGISRSIEDRASLLTRLKGFQLITDDNMGTEWK